MQKTTACLTGLLIAAGMIGCAPSINSAPPKAELLVALPDYCKSPDGLALLKDNSVIVSVPNFNDETKPPLLLT